MRLDALRILWLFRRPVGYKAQDIGITTFIVNDKIYKLYSGRTQVVTIT